MTIRPITSMAAAALLSACASQVWEKPGSTPNDFTKARYACMEQAQQRVVSTNVNEHSRVITNGTLFDACMTSLGWTLQKPIPAEQRARINEVAGRYAPLFKEICARPDLQVHFRKSPCDEGNPSFEQLADNSRISEPEKLALAKLITAVRALNDRMVDEVRQASPDYAAVIIREHEALQALVEKASLEFYDGRTTRGEYNSVRKDIAQRSQGWSVK